MLATFRNIRSASRSSGALWPDYVFLGFVMLTSLAVELASDGFGNGRGVEFATIVWASVLALAYSWLRPLLVKVLRLAPESEPTPAEPEAEPSSSGLEDLPPMVVLSPDPKRKSPLERLQEWDDDGRGRFPFER